MSVTDLTACKAIKTLVAYFACLIYYRSKYVVGTATYMFYANPFQIKNEILAPIFDDNDNRNVS